jgi:hypothetical protein
MSDLDKKQKLEIEGKIQALFSDIVMNYELPDEVTLQYLLQMKDRLTQVFDNAVRLHERAQEFNDTQTNESYQIKIGKKSTLGRILDSIKVKFIVIRDIFLQQLKSQPQTLTQPQVDEMRDFLNSRINTHFVRDATLVRPPPPSSQVGSPVRHSRHQSVAQSPPVVSPTGVVVNPESPPTAQLGCFGRMCHSIKSKLFPPINRGDRGGKRKLRRRTRRTRRGRGRRSRLN